MKIFFPKSEITSPQHFIRRAGYGLLMNRDRTQMSFVRRLSRDLYPRFHLYVEDRGSDWSFNLHLDQRAPVYAGVTAHGGEYDGPLVEGEAARLRSLLAPPANQKTSRPDTPDQYA